MEKQKKTPKKRKIQESLKIENKKPKLESSKRIVKKEKVKEENDCNPQWQYSDLLSEEFNLDSNISQNVINLLEDGNTIPFIARYRRNLTNNMSADDLRAAKDHYDKIIIVKNKMVNVFNTLKKSNLLNDEIKNVLTVARSVDEIEHIYAPYKTGGKATLADKAKKLGLEEVALNLLHNKCAVVLEKYINSHEEGLANVLMVKKGIIHILANIFSTDTEVLSSMNDLKQTSNFVIKTKKVNSKKESKENEESKFVNYFDFEIPMKYIKPHQVLAINRGESLKILSCSVIVPPNIFNNYKEICSNKWLYTSRQIQMRTDIIMKSIEDSYSRLVEPSIKRKVRAELKQKADRASCEVFSTNLKQLLLTLPTKGKSILGIDPGFANGCKLAVISPMGNLIVSDVIYPHSLKIKQENSDKAIAKLKHLIVEHNCEIVALGNGTACRQTEEFLANLIESNVFKPVDVKYTIVREEGASIYSCSSEAKKEFPSLDPNIISAVSLARRVQEPLAEFIKVEPKHLGIGMYQHDVKKTHLDTALNDVISECVSFVGVDLNTTSHCLLKHVAGLSDKKSEQIINYRNKKGPFTSREQLLEVQGIGPKVFQQCGGFLRVAPLTKDDISFYKNPKSTKLDCTNIHPESYKIAKQLITKLQLKLNDVGTKDFISTIKRKISEVNSTELSVEFSTNPQTIELILDALSKPLNYDLRDDCYKEPLFKKGLTSISDLRVGSILTGAVNNVTHFGSFVDIGVGSNGLLHVSKSRGLTLEIGTKVEVRVLNVDVDKKRIQLEAVKILQ